MPNDSSQTSGQSAEQAEDAFLGQFLVNNGVPSALTPSDSPTVVATVDNLAQQAGNSGGK